VDVARIRVDGRMVMLTFPVAVWVGLPESVTLIPILKVPEVVGVPLTRQLAPRPRPLGRDPDVIVQL
jgi:hypothetical protein